MRVPTEVHLVIPRVGGRDDYDALMHEAGHAEHYAHVDAALPFEHRYLGDNSVTEGFAFLLEHLAADAAWLEHVLGVDDAAAVQDHARGTRLLFLRRYSAKLAYEMAKETGDKDLLAEADAQLFSIAGKHTHNEDVPGRMDKIELQSLLSRWEELFDRQR